MADVVGSVLWAVEQVINKLAAAKAEFVAAGRARRKDSVTNMSLDGGLPSF